MRKIGLLTLLILSCFSAHGQKADLRRGNRQFKKEKYQEADISYRKGLMQDTTSVAAKYNLANNLYRQENYDEAAKILDSAKEAAPAEAFAPDYYFNRGDVAMAKEDWQAAVEAFQECLLRTPEDLQAKENYIYARNKLMEQQQQNGGGDGNDQQDQDQDQNQDQNQDQQQDQDQDQNQNQNQNQNQDQQQKDEQQEQQLSPQQAQQLLQAIREKEKQTQEKVDEKKAAALKSRQKDKNW